MCETLSLILALFWRAAELSGSAPPGIVWLLTDRATVVFRSDDVNNLPGFDAAYRAANTSHLSGTLQPGVVFQTLSWTAR